MGKGKKEIRVEYRMSMYCNACERTVAKIISKFKGVETFTTDMRNHKILVKGRIDSHKLLKKLKKKTGKNVEIVENKQEDNRDSNTRPGNSEPEPERSGPEMASALLYLQSCCREDLLMAFSDENPNACSIM